MKKIIKSFIIGSSLEQPLRKLFHNKTLASASIDPIIPYLKEKFAKKNDISVLEIGARYGDSSHKLIKELRVKSYVIIDPYVTYEDYAYDDFDNVLKSGRGDAIFNNTKARLQPLVEKLTFHRLF